MPENTLIDFHTERQRRIHNLHEKRLQEVRAAFERALPSSTEQNKGPRKKRKASNKPKKT